VDKNEIINTANRYLEAVKSLVNVTEAYVFGSRVDNTAREDSDIDTALFTDTLHGDYFNTLTRLFKIRRTIDPLLEPHLFINGQDQSGFQDEVKKKGIKIV